MKNNTHENEEPKNHFDSLPDALLIEIFNKLIDAKTLVRCSSVSKRFTSLIRQTDVVFFRFNPCENPQPSYAPSYALPLLKNMFCNVKSLQMDLHYPSKNCSSVGDVPFLRWKVVLGTNVESCVILFASSIINHFPTDSNIGEELIEEARTAFLKLANICLREASIKRDFFVKYVLPDLESLQDVVISDDKYRGKLSMRDEQLAELRSSSMIPPTGVQGPLHMKLCYVPVLKLPSSGYTMDRVMIATIRRSDHPIVMERDVQLLTGAFVDQGELGKVFDEAVMEIVKIKKKKTYDLAIP